jgi:polysaccharide export outer membrane protein
MRHNRLKLTAFLPLLLAGCASGAAVGAPAQGPVAAAANGSNDALALASAPNQEVSAADRAIAAMDLLEITVFEAPEFSRTVRVSDAGDISLPLLGVTPAAGKTPRQLESALRSRLQQSYMRDPHVTVEVKEFGTPPIYVVGEVNQPGAFVPSGSSALTVLRAVAMARGTKATAATGRVVVLRPVANGDRLQLQVNLNDVARGKTADLALQANDVVYVPKNTERSIALGAVDALLRTVTLRAVF